MILCLQQLFFQRKIWFRFLIAFFTFFSFQLSFLYTASASDNNVPPCLDAKGTGTYVPTGLANNAGKITFDPDGGPPDFAYQVCLFDPGNDGIGPFEVKGWAWDDNLGWVSFFCDGTSNLGIACGNEKYGVTIDGPETGASYGTLHGYAWGDNIGWINMSCIGGKDALGQACGAFDYYVHAEDVDTDCLGVVFADVPPQPGCDKNPDKSVFAWADSVGWINFTGVFFPLPGAPIPLPPQVEEVDVAFELDPVLTNVNKNTARLSDNSDAYTLTLTFTKTNSVNSPFDPADYNISAEVTWLQDSIDRNQTDSENGNYVNCHNSAGPGMDCDTGAVTKPLDFSHFVEDPMNPSVFKASVKSMAPSSSMNGMDTNADGSIEFPYESFVFGNPGAPLTVPENKLSLGQVKVAVIQASDGACVFGDNAPASCDLKSVWAGNQTFPFVPAIEVTEFDDAGDDFIETSNSEIEQLHTNTVCRGAMFDCNATVFFQLGFDVQNPPYTFVVDLNNDGFTHTDPTSFTMPGYADFGNDFFQASPKSADPMMPNPAENAYIWSRVDYNIGGHMVSYFSNKLPRATGSYLVNPLASIKGNAYSTGVTNLQGGMIIKPSGDVSTNLLRDFIARNVSHIIAGVDDPPENTTSQLTSNGTLFVIGNGGSSGKTLLPDGFGPRVYYFRGDVVLTGNSDLTWKGERTIITIGGNVFIDKNLYNQNLNPNEPKPKLGIIALKNFKTGKGGNVYIAPNVTDIQAHMFMDGSLHSYSGNKDQINANGEPLWLDDKTRHDTLIHQLAIEGSVASLNTIGGALRIPPVLGNGATEVHAEGSYGQNPNGRSRARLYDLNFLRYYGWVFERNLDGSSRDQNNDGFITAELAPAGDLISPPAGIAQKSLMLQANQKFATYILFDPVSPTLPGFGVQGGLSVQQKP